MKPPLACDNCRSRKKKCDRIYPICSNCLQTSRRCRYRGLKGKARHNVSEASEQDLQILQQTTPPTATGRLATNLFHLGTISQSSNFPISAEVQSILDSEAELGDYLGEYLEAIDRWMPIIPRTYLQECVKTPAFLRSSEQSLLLACIMLLVRQLEEDDACTKDYYAVKFAFVQIEALDALTLRTTQARFLLLVYEFGHAINQAACTSLNVCMGYLASLGIDNDRAGCGRPYDWLIEEQARRLWWAGFVLDRALTLGCIRRPLLINAPTETKLLPSDEESWQLERSSPASVLTVSSPATAHMGSFRLLVLASNLLALAFEYRNDIDLHNADLIDQIDQLYRTLCSFSRILEIEAQSQVSIGAARGFVNSAIFILYQDLGPLGPEIYENFPGSEIPRLSPTHESAQLFLERSHIYLRGELAAAKESSPFLLYWAHHTFRFYYQAFQADRREEYQLAVQELTKVFWKLNEKWKLAGAYMRLVSASQLEQM